MSIDRLREAVGNKVPNNVAFFISPRGKIFSVSIHIMEIISNPAIFGLSKEEVEETFKKHGEKIGSEGNAREEIIRSILKRGWIRIRKYGNSGYSINTYKLDDRSKDHITAWAESLLSGADGFLETDKYASVRIDTLLGVVIFDLNDIAHFKLFREEERGVTSARFVESILEVS